MDAVSMLAGGSLVVAVVGILWMHRQLKVDRCSPYLGIAFMTALLALGVQLTYTLLMAPNATVGELLALIVILVYAGLVVMFPVLMVVTSIAGAFHAVQTEGTSPGRVAWLVVSLAYPAFLLLWPLLRGSGSDGMRSPAYLVVAGLFLVASVCFAVYLVTWFLNLRQGEGHYAYIVAMGDRLEDGEDITRPVLHRLDLALDEHLEDPSSHLVIQGGRDLGDKHDESELMLEYITSAGEVQRRQVLVETTPGPVVERVAGISRLLAARRTQGRVLLVTNTFATLSTLDAVTELGLDYDVAGAPVGFGAFLAGFGPECLRGIWQWKVLLLVFAALLVVFALVVLKAFGMI